MQARPLRYIVPLVLAIVSAGCESRPQAASPYAVYSAAIDAVTDSLGLFREPLLILDTAVVPIPDLYDGQGAKDLQQRVPDLEPGLVDRAAAIWDHGGHVVDSFSISADHVLLSGAFSTRLKETASEDRPGLIKRRYGSNATIVCLGPPAIGRNQALVVVSAGCWMQGSSFPAVSVALKKKDGKWQAVYLSTTWEN